MTDEINIVVKADDQFSGVLGNFGNIMTGIKSTIDLVGMAFNTAKDFIMPFVDSASESEQALTGLDNVIRSAGLSAGLTKQNLIDMSSALQSVTRYSDEEIQSAEGMLLRFENLNPIFKDALGLTLDYAASLKLDLTSAAQTVGKALDDPASGIGRLNMQFKLFNETEMETIKKMAENGDIAEAQALIMDRLREKVGGAAEAFGNTFAGKLDIARNKLDDIKELIGGALLPKFTELLDWFINFSQSPDVKNFTDALMTALTTGDFSEMDKFFANIISSLKVSIDVWANGTGPQELSDKIIQFIDSIGTGTETDSKALNAMGRLFDALARAIEKIDWSTIGWKFDAAISRVITNQDWSASGDAFGDAVEKFFTEGWDIGSSKSVDTVKSASGLALQNAIRDFFVGAIGGEESAAYWSSAWENLMTTDLDQVILGIFKGLFFEVGGSVGQWIIDGIKSNKDLDNLGITIKSLIDIWKVFNEIGEDAFQGLIDGMNERYWFLIGRLVIWIASIGQTAKNILGISSPSTIFFDIGVNIIQGLIDGFESLLSDWYDILNKVVPDYNNITGGASGNFGGFGTATNTSTISSGQVVNNYFYGTVYIGSQSDLNNGAYDCPSPNPLMTAGTTLVPHAL